MSADGEKKSPGVIQFCATWGLVAGFALAVLAKILGDAPLVPAVLAGAVAGGLLGALVGCVVWLFIKLFLRR
jgi:hypothetical protein